LQFISDLPLIHVDRHRVFVHAGVDPALSLEQQSEQVLLWKRYPQQSKEGHGARHVVHGHDADPSGPVVTSGRTNLDSLAWKMGRLVVGVFDDNVPGGACDFIEVVSRNR
jgi:serine/threonine protein phosphatase 1